MSKSIPPASSPNLSALRAEIDRLDRIMHDALMERSTVIEALVEAKRTAETGASFRPAREASMLKALSERHKGILPFTVVEHIWREIIAAFTQMQGAFTVHVEETEDRVMRDAARYHFGFSTPITGHGKADDVVDAVLGAQNDLGMLQITPDAASPWWQKLHGTNGQIIARYPFVVGAPHGAETPCLLIARDVTEQAPLDYSAYSISCSKGCLAKALETTEVSLLAAFYQEDGQVAALVSLPRSEEETNHLSAKFGTSTVYHLVGGYSAPIIIS